MLQQLYFVLLAAKFILSSGTPLRSEQTEFGDRELPLRKHSQQFLSDGARSAYDRYNHNYAKAIIVSASASVKVILPSRASQPSAK